jgi:hypothetical protein
VRLGHLGAPGLQRREAHLAGIGEARRRGRRRAARRRLALAPAACDTDSRSSTCCSPFRMAREPSVSLQRVERFRVHRQRADGDQLPQHAAQLRLAELRAEPEGGHRSWPNCATFSVLLAAQDVHHVAGAEADAALLLHPVDGGQQLARGVGAIPDVGRVQAVVAVAARLGRLAEVPEQPHAPAVGGLGQRQQRVELAAHHLLVLLGGGALVDHAALVDHVLQAVGHPGLRRQAVAAPAAGLLVVALDVLGHVQVGDEAHVGLVDAHAEGDGGAHHHAVVAQEAVLVGAAAPPASRPAWYGSASSPRSHSSCRRLLDALARLAVDDAGVALVLGFQEAQQLLRGVLLLDDAVADVGAVEAADELARLLQLQPLDDVGAREVVGGGGERDARHAGVALVQHRQAAVLGPEVVAPLADAVRFVDGEQGQLAARAGCPAGSGTAAWSRARAPRRAGDLAARQPPLDVLRLLEGERGIEERGLDPASCSAPTWSCISAMSGDTTTLMPWPARWRAMAGTW